jgi:hypothetical protein
MPDVRQKTSAIIENKAKKDEFLAWQVIKDLYKKKNILRISNLQIKLNNTKLEEKKNIDKYLLRISKNTIIFLATNGKRKFPR